MTIKEEAHRQMHQHYDEVKHMCGLETIMKIT
jgi:hypothetical protein